MDFHFPDFTSTHVLVIGDVMLDRYWSGGTERISPEAPVPVVHIQQEQNCPGGAANVALNLQSLGVQVNLAGIVGDDPEAKLLETQLHQANINYDFVPVAGKPTINKLRVMSRHQQLLRMDFEASFCDSASAQAIPRPWLQADYSAYQSAQVVVLSDYGKGSLGNPQSIIQQARKQLMPILVDPKGRDFSIYQGATLLTPNLKEFEGVVGVCHSQEQIVAKGQQLLQQLKLDALLVTQGAQGMTLIQATQPALQLPAHCREVFDVTGAGDTVIATLAAGLAAGCDLEEAVTLANRAASLVVTKLGAATLSAMELKLALLRDLPQKLGVVTENELLPLLLQAKHHGETIVMTNGCFDVLHAGHIQYLTQAKALGDRLVVAVNDDASVKRLKGNYRPIHPLQQRMQVLAALEAVDWVVPFSEDTPLRLIETLLPQVLVKGGDYQLDGIVGAKTVIAHGGQVKVLPFVEGCSTSSIVEKINKL